MIIVGYNNCVDCHSDTLYRFVLKHIKDEDATKDIVQDTYEKVWRKVNDIKSKNAESYLFTAAHHTLIDYTRKQKKQAKYTDTIEQSLRNQQQYCDIKIILNDALDKLPDIQKSVVLLRN